jgi:lipoic acid synthetase
MQEFSDEKPGWLKIRPPKTDKYGLVKKTLAELGLNTVCASAKCPNAFECWDNGELTFMILGNVCTRACRFCAVHHARRGLEVDLEEPAAVAEAASRLGLSYVVITSVDRDDLDDQGAGHYVACIGEIKRRNPGARVEAVIPDFGGRTDFLRKVIDAGPDMIAHNVETVERTSPTVRDRRAGYYRSIDVLRNVKRFEPGIMTKSSIMLGLGEEEDEVKETIRKLHEARVDVLTMGQYLCPGENCLPVQRYVPPEEFDRLKGFAESLGFKAVVAGPFVRSSYRASKIFPGTVKDDRR